MKTLNEVITVMDHVEFCCTNCKLQFDCDEVECFLEDALHYLKEYHDAYGNVIASMNHHLRKIHELEQNDPLTWEELQQMEGKPVWVEDNIDEPEDLTKYWAIYRRIEKAQETEYALLSDFYYDKAQYGKTWQAYRKERTDGLSA